MNTSVQFDADIIASIGAFADEQNVEAFVVGGYVRDLIIGKHVTDIDVTIVGDAVAFAKEFARRLKKSEPVIFEKFGTAMLTVGTVKLEFVGTRKESYEPHSRKPIVTVGTLHDDLARRDFTCNALAASLNEKNRGALIDPFDGQKAIREKKLITPLDPETTFSDDPLRMMRACRFASQLGFTIEPHVAAAIEAMAQRIEIVSAERIRDEFIKILETPKPSVGLDALYKLGLLRFIFPELHGCAGVDQRSVDYPEGPRNHHHKDVFYHTLLVVDNISRATENVWLRMAALLHDIAKPQTKSFDEANGWSFHGHEVIGARMVKRIFDRMRLPHDPIRYVQRLVMLHLRPIALVKEEVSDSAIRRLLFETGADIDDLMMLCRADITSKNPAKVKQYLSNYERVVSRMKAVEEKDRLRNWQPPLRGDEIMSICGIEEGLAVGILKTRIEDAILDGVIPNEHDAARDYLISIKDETLAEPIQHKPRSKRSELHSLPTFVDA